MESFRARGKIIGEYQTVYTPKTLYIDLCITITTTVTIAIMSKRIIKYKDELCFLGTCSKKQRCNYIKIAPGEVINAIDDVANTVLRGQLPIKEPQRKKF